MMKAKLFAVISSFLMLTGCGSFSESTPAVTVQSENSSVMMQSDSSVSSVTSDKQEVTTAEQHEEKEANGMQIAVGDKQFPVNLESSDTVTALTEMLPLTLDMSELNGNEKYKYLSRDLPMNEKKVKKIKAGDVKIEKVSVLTDKDAILCLVKTTRNVDASAVAEAE